MNHDMSVTRGGANIFDDLGLPNAEEHLLKAQIVSMLRRTIQHQRLSQKAAAERMGIAQPDVSRLFRGRFEGFSLERLLRFLVLLGYDVNISVVEVARENEGTGHLRLAHA